MYYFSLICSLPVFTSPSSLVPDPSQTGAHAYTQMEERGEGRGGKGLGKTIGGSAAQGGMQP